VSVKFESIYFDDFMAGTWTCWLGGNGELESVDHGWSRDPEVLAGDEGKCSVSRSWIDRVPYLLDKGAGCARVQSSSSPFSFFSEVDYV